MSTFRSQTRLRGIWLISGVAFVFVAASGALSTEADSSPSTWVTPKTSVDTPNFTLERLDGRTFYLQEHRGEVVVLNFWATWGPPCRDEIPDFVRMQRALGDRGVQFVGVALEQNPDPEAVRAFAEAMNVNYPMGLDDGTIARTYGGVRTLPTTFVIGPKGEIRGRIRGRTTEARLRPALETRLSELLDGSVDDR